VDLPKSENLGRYLKKEETLDEYIKPAVASDGGNIVFEGYEESTGEVRSFREHVAVVLLTMTLRNGNYA
jgi:hypothetical protein